MATVAAGTAAVAGAAALLNHRFGFTRDISEIRQGKDFLKRHAELIEKLGSHATLYHLLELADPMADAIWFEGRTWSYQALKSEVDYIAAGLQELGVKNNDIIAVFMTNSPEMVFTCYALSKLGAAPALINSALRDDTLIHCARLANSKMIIATSDLARYAADAAEAIPHGDHAIHTYALNLGNLKVHTTVDEEKGILKFPFLNPANLPKIEQPPRSISDVMALIYTSGTTGKPKACSIKNIMAVNTGLANPGDMTNPEKYFPMRTYSCMPLFHGTTFFTALCYSVGNSGCYCIARKFSARNFWRDVHDSRATKILYVGELCRFLMATPPGPYDRNHNCQMAMGNGLQKDVWVAFQKRFNVPEVREFYRSTEGLVMFDNRHFAGRTGAGKVQYNGAIKRRQEKNQYIVKFDHDTELPYRDPKTGFCVVADLDEPGEAIAKVRNLAAYSSYHNNPAATESKFLRDVFEKGDLWQKAGDLLMQESSGWVRFVDRIGDTFRWKGENVSAGEIRNYICEIDGIHDAVVVGKKLDKYDGQAGVAAIHLVPAPTPESEAKIIGDLYSNLKRKGVPSYAFPRLVMVTDEIAVGHTFKHAKQVVKAIEWDPTRPQTGDGAKGNRYWLKGNKYVNLDEKGWDMIGTGKAKL